MFGSHRHVMRNAGHAILSAAVRISDQALTDVVETKPAQVRAPSLTALQVGRLVYSNQQKAISFLSRRKSKTTLAKKRINT
jgi:hypothetical protein